MSRLPIQVRSGNEYGIIEAHWNAILFTASSLDYLLCFRGGKPAAMPWIKLGYPAKPLGIDTKVDPVLGLLIARTPEDVNGVWSEGYPVLVPVVGKRGWFEAKLHEKTVFNGRQFNEPWAQEGVVIDPEVRLPITSDYDLAAVIDTTQADYNGTYMSMSGFKDKNNWFVKNSADILNSAFGSRRILHGSKAQHTGSMAHNNYDTILVFHPDRTVQCYAELTVIEGMTLLHELFLQYFPDKGHLFSQ